MVSWITGVSGTAGASGGMPRSASTIRTARCALSLSQWNGVFRKMAFTPEVTRVAAPLPASTVHSSTPSSPVWVKANREPSGAQLRWSPRRGSGRPVTAVSAPPSSASRVRRRNIRRRLMALAAGSIRRPAIRSSVRDSSASGIRLSRCVSTTWALSGDTEIPGVGGASAIRTMLSGGIW